MSALRGLALLLAAGFSVAGCTAMAPERMERFADARAFVAGIEEIERTAVSRDLPTVVFEAGVTEAGVEPPQPAPRAFPGDAIVEEVVLTGAALADAAVTNNQEAGVDEGGIVKLVGEHLVMLRDGRLFAVDLGPRGPRLSDRIDLYDDARDAAWYDELLVHGRRLVVLAYDPEEDASEVIVLELDGAGRFRRGGRLWFTSGDYYSHEDSSARLVDGQLLFHMPLGDPDLDALEAGAGFAAVRGQRADGRPGPWRPLLRASDVLRPVGAPPSWPAVHAIVRCDLDARRVACEAVGVLASEEVVQYTGPRAFYVWSIAGVPRSVLRRSALCAEDRDVLTSPSVPGTLWRFPHDGSPVDALAVEGLPPGRFAFAERGERLHVLVERMPGECRVRRWADVPLTLDTLDFGDLPAPPTVAVRDLREGMHWNGLRVRFSARQLLYAPETDRRPRSSGDAAAELRIVQLDDALPPARVPLDHGADRIELLGPDVVVLGRSPATGLTVSLVEPGPAAVRIDTLGLGEVFEAEGRSHAFNGLARPDGSATFGLPVAALDWRGRPLDRADLQLFEVDAERRLGDAGRVLATAELPDNGYACEVSCVEWYGAARLVFIGARIFALSGEEFTELRLVGGGLEELTRLRLTDPLSPGRRRGSG